MDWHSRKVLSWRVSNTMDVKFLRGSVGGGDSKSMGGPRYSTLIKEASSQAEAFTGVLKRNGIRISMDGKRSWMDNVFIERLWRSLKYEEVYLKAYDSVRFGEGGDRGMDRFLQHSSASSGS